MTACRRHRARPSSSGCGPRSTLRRSKPSRSSRSTRTGSRRSSVTPAGRGELRVAIGYEQVAGQAVRVLPERCARFDRLLQQGAQPCRSRPSSSTTSAESSAARSWCRGCTTDATRRFSSRRTRRTGTRRAAAPRTATIPTAAMLTGDFSEWRDANGNLIPIYDPATTRVNPNGARVRPRSVSGKYDPAPSGSVGSPVRSLKLATMRPGPAGRAQQFRLHPGRRHQHEPLEQVQPQARSQPLEQGSSRIPLPLGRGAGHSAERRAHAAGCPSR